jgi:hypothetical protein
MKSSPAHVVAIAATVRLSTTSPAIGKSDEARGATLTWLRPLKPGTRRLTPG